MWLLLRHFFNRKRKYYKEIIIVVVKCGIQFIKTIHSRKQNDEAMTTQQKSEDSQVEIGSKNLCVALKLRYNKNGRVNTRLFCLGIKISNGMLLQRERDSIVVNFVDVFARVVIFTQDIIVCLEWLPFSFCFFFFFFFFLWQG